MLNKLSGMLPAIFLGLALAALADPAFAQGVQAFTTWAIGPTLLGGMVALFIALVGVLLMAGQHTWTGIAFVVVGAVLIGSAVTIGGMFGTGG